MNAWPTRMDIGHEVNLTDPILDFGVDPMSILREVYACVSPAFKITPNDITVTKSDNIGQTKLIISVLNGNGTIEFTANGYISRFENLTDNDQVNFMLDRIGQFDQNIEKLPPFRRHRRSSVYFGTWYSIHGGRPEIDRLLNALTPLDHSEQIGATSSWNPSYRRNYYNKNEDWLLAITLEPSAFDVDHLYCSVLAHHNPHEPNWSVAKMVAHTHVVRDTVLQSIGIEVQNA